MSALTGTLVVSLEQAVAAPYATRLLAEAGARVIKIERDEGDFARAYDTVVNGESAYFIWLNAGKESLVLDVKNPADCELLSALLKKADVFIQNLRPCAVERLGFSFDAVAALNPRLVMCSISGYGSTGPLAEMKAYDFLVQAETGLCSITGTPTEATRCGVSICDISTGLTAYGEIMRALLERTNTGRGQHLEISLFDVMSEWMAVPLAYYKYGGKILTGTGLDHTQIAPYGAYETADGVIIIAVQNHREWLSLCETLGRPALAHDERFKTNPLRVANRAALKTELELFFTRHTRSELAEILERGSIAYGRINSVKDVWSHAALKIKEVTSAGNTATFVRRVCDESTIPRTVPAVGAHTTAIRREFIDE
ncbi:MAG: CoA transferase [Gammaproteobacteria bacterium]|nr:CoA transferase [Gammaproteobacteria bacterium]